MPTIEELETLIAKTNSQRLKIADKALDENRAPTDKELVSMRKLDKSIKSLKKHLEILKKTRN